MSWKKKNVNGPETSSVVTIINLLRYFSEYGVYLESFLASFPVMEVGGRKSGSGTVYL